MGKTLVWDGGLTPRTLIAAAIERAGYGLFTYWRRAVFPVYEIGEPALQSLKRL